MKNFDAIVIGAGPGGYPCAIRLAQEGKKVAIVEKEKWGGVCLNVGCIPSKALIHASSSFYKTKHLDEMGISVSAPKLDVEKMQTWKSGVVNQLTKGVSGLLKMNGVTAFSGAAAFKDPHTLEITSAQGKETLTAKDIVIATGSRVMEIPILKFNGINILDSTQALELKKLPSQLVVVGGGFIGLEIGMAYAKLGSQVTIVEALDQLLASVEKELVQVVEKKMRELGMKVLTSTKALGLKEKNPEKEKTIHLEVETKEGKKTLEADAILVSVGRKPNSEGMGLEKIGVKIDPRGNIVTDSLGQTNVKGVWAIGDVTGAPQLAHRATQDGLLVASSISGKKAYKDYKTVPWAVFVDPEIATAGLTEKEAKEKGISYRVGKFPFAANGRALSTQEGNGFFKVLIDEKTESVIGVHIVGPEASNLIAEATLAIEMGASVEDLVRTIHTHPTLPEAFPEAVELAYSKAIHVFKK